MAVGHKRRRRPQPRHIQPRTHADQPVSAAARAAGAGGVVSEIIGRASYGQAQTALFRSRTAITTVDATVPDYAFYDLLRRGKQPGYKLGALFAPRIERVLAAWIFGEGVNVTLNKDIAAEYPEEAVKYTNEQLKNFVDGLLDSGQDTSGDGDDDKDLDLDDQSGALLTNVFKDAVGLGDQYPFVNADGSISVPSPDTVEIERDPLDYRRWVAARITTRMEEATIIDEYRADGRTVTIRRYENGRNIDTVERYANLIGRIPAVHVAYGRSGNETNGHSIHEFLLKLYDQYDDVLHKMLDGAKLLGNPLLAFTGLKDLAAVVDANQPLGPAETYVDMNGAEITRPQLNIDRNSILLVGEGGDAKFVSPPVGFTDDTKQALKTLFLLLLDHTGIPESIWGNEMSSARASSETQLTQFVKELRGWQKDNGGWVARLCKIWLQFRALTDPQLIVDKLTVTWPTAIEEDKELVLKFIEFAKREALLTAETALRLTNLVEDPAAESEAAQAEADARAAQEQERMIATAQATQPPQRGAVGEMQTNGYNAAASGSFAGSGYNEAEAKAIVRGAIRDEAAALVAGGMS